MLGTIDTYPYTQLSHKPWHKDRRYTEVWGSLDNGKSWTMLGMEGPEESKRADEKA